MRSRSERHAVEFYVRHADGSEQVASGFATTTTIFPLAGGAEEIEGNYEVRLGDGRHLEGMRHGRFRIIETGEVVVRSS